MDRLKESMKEIRISSSINALSESVLWSDVEGLGLTETGKVLVSA